MRSVNTLIFILFSVLLLVIFKMNSTVSQLQDAMAQMQGTVRALQSDLTSVHEKLATAQPRLHPSAPPVQNVNTQAYSPASPKGRTQEGALGGGAEGMDPSKNAPFCEAPFGKAHCDPKGELICDQGKKTRLRKGLSDLHKPADVIRYVCMP